MGLSLRGRKSLGKKLAWRNRLVPLREIRVVPAQKLQSDLHPSHPCLSEVPRINPTSEDHSPPMSAYVSQSAGCPSEAGTQNVCPLPLLSQSRGGGGNRRRWQCLLSSHHPGCLSMHGLGVQLPPDRLCDAPTILGALACMTS